MYYLPAIFILLLLLGATVDNSGDTDAAVYLTEVAKEQPISIAETPGDNAVSSTPKFTADQACEVVAQLPDIGGQLDHLTASQLGAGVYEVTWAEDLGSGLLTTINAYVVDHGRIVARMWETDADGESVFNEQYAAVVHEYSRTEETGTVSAPKTTASSTEPVQSGDTVAEANGSLDLTGYWWGRSRDLSDEAGFIFKDGGKLLFQYKGRLSPGRYSLDQSQEPAVLEISIGGYLLGLGAEKLKLSVSTTDAEGVLVLNLDGQGTLQISRISQEEFDYNMNREAFNFVVSTDKSPDQEQLDHALIHAVESDNKKMVDLLLNAGANPNTTNLAGNFVLEIAEGNNASPLIIAALKRAGAVKDPWWWPW